MYFSLSLLGHALVNVFDGLACMHAYAAGVGDAGLIPVAALTALTQLHLDSRGFTDAGLRTIAPLTGLRHLDLFGAKITDAGCVHLR